MANESEAMQQVRASLCARIDAIAADLMRQGPARYGPARRNALRLCENVDLVRGLAQAHGMMPLAQLARTLEGALAAGERGVMVTDTLGLMREAAGCISNDGHAGEAFAAALSVRFAG